MKTMLVALFVGIAGLLSNAQETGGKTEKPKLTQEELEAKFKKALDNVTFRGRWCTVNEGRLGAEKKDQYTILGVTKIGADAWMLRARIQYGDNDLVAPIPLQVKWAGDTAVMIVNNFALPGSETYSARVLVHDNSYAGTWSGGDHGGLLNGVIVPTSEPAKSE